LASAGLIRRLTEPNRDRVRQVVVTPAGRAWIDEHCGNGAIADLGLHWSDSSDLLRSAIEA
jgi:DNA-binding MarR family transcriptional regulator